MNPLQQYKPDFYYDISECKEKDKAKINTNPRYPQFNQRHFTAGDEEQFQKFRDKSNGKVCSFTTEELDLIYSKNRFNENKINIDSLDWDGYKDIPASAVDNTFRYLFYKFKKAIFIKLQDNQLKVFLPFSFACYTNEWGDKIKYDPTKFSSLSDFLEYVSINAGYNFNPKRVDLNTWRWYGNNCIIRYEYPTSEGDTGVNMVRDMFIELCKYRIVPDIEFFVNKRDFPVLTKDRTEPYEAFFGNDTPLISHNYETYSPVMSYVTTDRFADILIPTWEDWIRVRSESDGVIFPSKCREYNEEFIPRNVSFDIVWSMKKNIAVFRGSSTGCGVTIETNPRLKLAYLSSLNKKDIDGKPFLNAGITKWNLRPRKNYNSPYLQTIDPKNLPFELSSYLSPQEQATYKYIINVDGHVTAFRLSFELKMGCVILLQESPYKVWYHNLLHPFIHYVPIKSDLSDLFEKIRWCKEHDSECMQIALNARYFYDQYLRKDGVLDALQYTLLKTSETIGKYFYNSLSPFQIQLKQEEEILKERIKIYPFSRKNLIPYQLPIQDRSFSLFKGVEWVLNYINSHFKINPTTDTFMGWDERTFSYFRFIENIRKTKNTSVDLFSFLSNESKNSAYIVIKNRTQSYADNPKGVRGETDRLVHECFIGQCVNELVKDVPNFMYTYGMSKKDTSTQLVLEYVGKHTLESWITSDSFNIGEYMFLLSQICLALYVAQNKMLFNHNDLHPWNVVLRYFPETRQYDYVISETEVLRLKTNVIPIFVDYEKSHISYNGIYYGYPGINYYKTSTIFDCISILVSSIYSILKNRTLNNDDAALILKLASFFSGTRYTHNQTFRNLRELRMFVEQAKKCMNMISSDKYELEEKNPLDLFNHILSIIKLPYTSESNLIYVPQKGSEIQVFKFILSDDIPKRIDSYISQFDNYLKNNNCIELSETKLYNNYIYYTLSEYFKTLFGHFDVYARSIKIDPTRYLKALQSVMISIEKYKNKGNDKDLVYNINNLPYNKLIEYDEYTFDNIYLLQDLSKKIDRRQGLKIIQTREMLIQISLTQGISNKEYFKDLFNLSPINSLIYVSNGNTFSLLLGILCKNNISDLGQHLMNENGFATNKQEQKELTNCNNVQQYITSYLIMGRNIL